MRSDDAGVSANLVLKDKNGNVVTPSSRPAWSLSQDGIVKMTVAFDGLSASFVPAGPVGVVTVDVLVDAADPTGSVKELHATGDIEVMAAEIATADLVFQS